MVDMAAGEIIYDKVRMNLPGDNCFLIFTGFLLKTVMLKSKGAYEILGHSYEAFLSADPAFNSLYKSFGYKYFGIEKSKGGLMSLLQ